jgi:hypothetical protein
MSPRQWFLLEWAFGFLAEGAMSGLAGETVELPTGRAGLRIRPSIGARKEETPYVSSAA